jgi:predicted PurR-regulated permease PerM
MRMTEPDTENNLVRGREVPWNWRTAARWAMVTAVVVGITAILWLNGAALRPFIIGLVLAYLMLPLVNRLERHVPRWAAILLVYLLTFGALGLALAYIIPPAIAQINELLDNIPQWYQNGQSEFQSLINRFQSEASPAMQQRVQAEVAQLQRTIEQNATAYTQRAASVLFNSVLRIFRTLTFLLSFVIIPFFLFYVLLDSQRLPQTLDRMLHPGIRSDVWNILRIVDAIFGKYIRGQLTLGLIIGVMSFVGLFALNIAGFHVQFTVLLAIVAAIGELIPVVGPILTAIPAIIVGAMDSARTALAVAVLYIFIQQSENQVLVPRIVGTTLKLPAALLMALLVIASQIGGLVLVILAAPLAAIGRDVFVYVHQRLQEPPVAPAQAIQRVLGDGRTTKV